MMSPIKFTMDIITLPEVLIGQVIVVCAMVVGCHVVVENACSIVILTNHTQCKSQCFLVSLHRKRTKQLPIS